VIRRNSAAERQIRPARAETVALLPGAGCPLLARLRSSWRHVTTSPMTAISIRMAGYGPPSTSFSRGLKLIGDRLSRQFGDRVDVKYVWNIMDFGYRAEEIWWLVEHGVLTLGYQSSSYLTDRVPELGIVDLPFFFSSTEQARAAMDGALGQRLAQAIEDRVPYRVLGWFENGFRHISNRLRPLHLPTDLAGMKIRVLPSDIQARTFALLGAEPVKCDLTEAIAWIKEGKLDAQENPLANTVTYGVHKFHRFHTLTNHFYISRPIFVHRPSFDAWPAELREAMRAAVQAAVAFQRGETGKEHEQSRAALEAEGCEIAELPRDGHEAFVRAVQPLYDDARSAYGEELFRLLPKP
jgi:TRAP-type C4-dicarboxylate transport system substrate-binding protein